MQWDAAVIAVRAPDGRVLALKDGRGLNFPGGMREDSDHSPAETAARELFEETGVKVKGLRQLGTWEGVVAFQGFGPKGKLRRSREGAPYWVKPYRVTKKENTFWRQNRAILEKMS